MKFKKILILIFSLLPVASFADDSKSLENLEQILLKAEVEAETPTTKTLRESENDTCLSTGKLAAMTMRIRQQGNQKKELLNANQQMYQANISSKEQYRASLLMIEKAWKKPQEKNDAAKRKMVNDFADDYYYQCLAKY